jgi:choice-of-anchor A domain-containing protein
MGYVTLRAARASGSKRSLRIQRRARRGCGLLAAGGILVGTAAAMAAAAPTSAWASGPDCSGALGTPGQYSEWVAGAVNRGPGTIGGGAAYGGSVTFGKFQGANGPTIAANLPANTSPLNLIIGGAVGFSGATTLAAGSGKVGGGASNPSALTVNGGGTISYNVGLAGLPFSFATVGATLAAASHGWAQATGVAPTISGGTLTFTGTNTTQDVFTVTEAQLAAATTVVINVPTATPNPTILINVSGSASFTNLSELTMSYTNGGTSQASTTLWNFNAATSVSLSGVSWPGTVVAPAVTTLTATNGSIDGSLIVGGSGAGGAFTTPTTSSWNTGNAGTSGPVLFGGTCLPSNSGTAPVLPDGRPLEIGAIGLVGLGGLVLVWRRRMTPAVVTS